MPESLAYLEFPFKWNVQIFNKAFQRLEVELDEVLKMLPPDFRLHTCIEIVTEVQIGRAQATNLKIDTLGFENDIAVYSWIPCCGPRRNLLGNQRIYDDLWHW